MIDLTPYTDANGDIDLKKELIQKFAGIVDSGSNENGDWIRFEDGTQICTKYSPATIEITPAINYLELGIMDDMHFPIPFTQVTYKSASGRPYTIGSISVGKSTVKDNPAYINYWKVEVLNLDETLNINNIRYLRLFAIGRWK